MHQLDAMLRWLNNSWSAGDNIVDIHATSRGRPGIQDTKINLSLSEGLIYERNTAKRLMEDLRKVCSLGIRDDSAPLQSMMDCCASLQCNLEFVLLYLGRSM